MASLPPTEDAARLHTYRVYHQVQEWLGNYKDPEDWGWKKTKSIYMPIACEKDPAPPSLLKLISCTCKTGCGKACGCRKAGLKCSPICGTCSGTACNNIAQYSTLQEDDDFLNDDRNLPSIPEEDEGDQIEDARDDTFGNDDEYEGGEKSPSKRAKFT